jgi:hypothetical protein
VVVRLIYRPRASEGSTLTGKPRSKRRSVWLCIAIVLTAGLLYLPERQSRPLRAEAATTAREFTPANSLGFKVKRNRADLLLDWNRESPAVVDALSGTLIIRAGNLERSVALTRDQLRQGSVLYAPTAGRVAFRLQIVGRDYEVTEDLLAVLP